MNPRKARTILINAKREYMLGHITHSELKEYARQYIQSIKEYGKKHKKKVPVPTVSQLLR